MYLRYMVFSPYAADEDDTLSQLCQVQIFFSLLSSVALKYDANTLAQSTNMDYLLSIFTFAPIVLALVLETPLADYIADPRGAASSLTRGIKSRRREALFAQMKKLPSWAPAFTSRLGLPSWASSSSVFDTARAVEVVASSGAVEIVSTTADVMKEETEQAAGSDDATPHAARDHDSV